MLTKYIFFAIILVCACLWVFDRILSNVSVDQTRPEKPSADNGIDQVIYIMRMMLDWIWGGPARLLAKCFAHDNFWLRTALTPLMAAGGYFAAAYAFTTFGAFGWPVLTLTGGIAIYNAIVTFRALDKSYHILAGMFAFWLTSASGVFINDGLTNSADMALPLLALLMWVQWVYGTIKSFGSQLLKF